MSMVNTDTIGGSPISLPISIFVAIACGVLHSEGNAIFDSIIMLEIDVIAFNVDTDGMQETVSGLCGNAKSIDSIFLTAASRFVFVCAL
jgi:hypothetical protein